jgi:ATP-binding cassette, subfamily C (CFTR/MRP), member 1
MPLTAATAFTSLTIFSLLGQAVSLWIESAMGVVTAMASLERIRQYLSSDTRVDFRISAPSRVRPRPRSVFSIPHESWMEQFELGSPEPPIPTIDGVITLRGCSANWDESSDPVLKGLNITIKRGDLAMVIGPVGSGKSTLLKVVLGEMPHITGSVVVQRVESAFCAQTPWLSNATIRANIVGQSRFDLRWYQTVIRACSLDQDFVQLADGDDSLVGSKGIILSGGQRSRVVSEGLSPQVGKIGLACY